MPSCIGSILVTMLWGGRSVSRGEQGESSCKATLDLSCYNHVLGVFSSRCHALREGRLHISTDNRGLAQVM